MAPLRAAERDNRLQCLNVPGNAPLQIRRYEEADSPAVCGLQEPGFSAAENFPQDQPLPRPKLRCRW